MNTETLSEKCYRIYEEGGYTAVMDYITENHPTREWFECEPCEMTTPFDDDRSCLVCGTLLQEVN